MFSRRLRWPNPTNRLSRLLREKRQGGVPVIDLTESNPTRVGLDYPAETIAAALGAAAKSLYEPDPRGLPAARAAIAAGYRARGLEAAPERILLTSSTSEAYSLLFKALADPGDAVLIPRPSYPLFDYLALLESVRVVPYPLAYDASWEIDLKALERLAETEGARAVVLVNPNNPTGSALRGRERAAVEDLCAARDLAVISDEVFFAYQAPPAAGHEGVSMLAPAEAPDTRRALSFTLDGLSKSCGMPQLKLGWMVVNGPERTAMEALERLDLIADTYLSTSTPVQHAAPRLLEIGAGIRDAIRRRVAANLAILRQDVPTGSPCRLLESDGGWSAVLQVPAVASEEDLVLWLLAYDDVLVHPGYFFDFPREAFLVLSLLPPSETFREGVRRILERASAA